MLLLNKLKFILLLHDLTLLKDHFENLLIENPTVAE